MPELKFITLVTPDPKGREEPRRHTLGYKDGGDRLATLGVIPHGSEWLPATRCDRDRLVKWLKALDYSADGNLVSHLGGKHGNHVRKD